jgi:hypothetical protein
MKFEWDPKKDASNREKHAVSFEEAASVFRGACLHRLDARHDHGETRLIALGVDSNGVLLNVVYTPRKGVIRIISAWKASKHERKTYAKAVTDGSL